MRSRLINYHQAIINTFAENISIYKLISWKYRRKTINEVNWITHRTFVVIMSISIDDDSVKIIYTSLVPGRCDAITLLNCFLYQIDEHFCHLIYHLLFAVCTIWLLMNDWNHQYDLKKSNKILKSNRNTLQLYDGKVYLWLQFQNLPNTDQKISSSFIVTLLWPLTSVLIALFKCLDGIYNALFRII